LTSPIRCASSTSTGRPWEDQRPGARPIPTTRGRRWVPPSSRGTPQRRSKRPKVDCGGWRSAGRTRAPARTPAGQAPAVDRGDRRLRGGEAGRAHRAGRVIDVEVHRLQVGAGAEGDPAGAGEDEDAWASGSAANSSRPVAKGLGGGVVDRVASLRAIDRQDRRCAAALVADFLCHRGPSSHSGRGRSRDGRSGRASHGDAPGVRRHPAPDAVRPRRGPWKGRSAPNGRRQS
jgi:hypothetical protein